jgi:WhiB family redox-sensing transcriptional regulator
VSWREKAACRGMDTSIFFPRRGEKLDRARAVCGRCSVRQECFEEAMALRDLPGQERLMGVWGGTSERDRRRDRMGQAA